MDVGITQYTVAVTIPTREQACVDWIEAQFIAAFGSQYQGMFSPSIELDDAPVWLTCVPILRIDQRRVEAILDEAEDLFPQSEFIWNKRRKRSGSHGRLKDKIAKKPKDKQWKTRSKATHTWFDAEPTDADIVALFDDRQPKIKVKKVK